MIRTFVQALSRGCSQVLLILIAMYRRCLSPIIGRQCRFYPTCSHYAEQAIIQHGPVYGSVLAACRICRCSPLGNGGIDHPPARLTFSMIFKPSVSRTLQNELNDGL